MDNTETRRLSVSDHFGFQPEFPERFDWSLVINGRHKELCQSLVEEIIFRRARWIDAGLEGIDPLIPGMQEALRVMAKQTIWKVEQIKTAKSYSFKDLADSDLPPVQTKKSEGLARKLR